MFRQERHYKEFFMGAVVGSTLGAMTALLLTTEEGKKLKKTLMHKFHALEKTPGMIQVKNKIKAKLRSKTKQKTKRFSR